MLNKIEFIIEGRAVPNKTLVGKNGHPYKPKDVKAFKELIQWHALLARACINFSLPFTRRENAVQMTTQIFSAIPKSWSKSRRSEALGSWKITVPDTDNIHKVAKDAMMPSLLVDDCVVARDVIEKSWAERDYIKITLEELPPKTKEIIE